MKMVSERIQFRKSSSFKGENRFEISVIKFSIFLILSFNILCAVHVAAASTNADLLGTFPRNNVAPGGPDVMDATVEMLGEDEAAIRKFAAQADRK